jgi:predicted acetyltransferase
MSVSHPIRPISVSELPEFAGIGEQAFNSNWPTEGFLELERLTFEPERSLAAFDGEAMIGSAEILSFNLTVPGGEVSAAGVTGVAVLPTHRRRGVLSALMRRQLADVAAGPEPVAALFASEAAIYGRYGYGAASNRLHYKVKRGEGQVRVRDGAPPLRLVEPKAALPRLRSVFEAFRTSRPGIMSRSQGYWDAKISDPEFWREGRSPERCLLAEDESGPRGYALYSTKPDWGADGLPAGVLYVHEAIGLDLASTTALWADLLSRDLVTEVEVWSRPVDDPLLYLLADPRRARASYRDAMWIRLIDLPAALTRRCYSAPVDLVIEVTDDLLPANAGRWRLQAGGLADPAKPSCDRTTDEPDLMLPVSALGAGYLGGIRLGAMAATAVITEQRPGAVAELSAAMSWDPAPWSVTAF